MDFINQKNGLLTSSRKIEFIIYQNCQQQVLFFSQKYLRKFALILKQIPETKCRHKIITSSKSASFHKSFLDLFKHKRILYIVHSKNTDLTIEISQIYVRYVR